jgi:radical SAM superfamily enzyme YgiQ (UPF0313 family)
MKIALVSMPFSSPLHAPLTISYLSSVLQQEGHNAKTFDKNIELYDKYKEHNSLLWDRNSINKSQSTGYFKDITLPLLRGDMISFVQNLILEDYKYFVFTVTYYSFDASYYISSLIKNLSPSSFIIWEGAAINSKSERVIETFKNGIVDVGIVPESEETISHLMHHLKTEQSYHLLPGLISSHSLKSKKLNPIANPVDIHSLPFPNFQDLDLKKYKSQELPIRLSRGCIANCTFCNLFATDRSYRVRNASSVIKEIRYHKLQYDISQFFFLDSLINGSLQPFLSLIDGMEELNCTWTATCRVDQDLTPEVLLKMYQSGCRNLLVGFESNSKDVLDSINKATTPSLNQSFINNVKNSGIKIHGNFLIGFPGETKQNFNQTLNFIHRNKIFLSRVITGQSLVIDKNSYISKNLDQFNISTDANGAIKLDHNKEWIDTKNIVPPSIRTKRLEFLNTYLLRMGLNDDENMVPQTAVKKLLYRLYYSINLLF